MAAAGKELCARAKYACCWEFIPGGEEAEAKRRRKRLILITTPTTT